MAAKHMDWIKPLQFNARPALISVINRDQFLWAITLCFILKSMVWRMRFNACKISGLVKQSDKGYCI